MGIRPLVFFRLKADLNLFEIHDVVDLAEIGEPFLRPHPDRVDIVDFTGGEHTPRTIMIRAVKTGVKVDPAEVDRYQAMLADWKIAPHLAELLKSELSARI